MLSFLAQLSTRPLGTPVFYYHTTSMTHSKSITNQHTKCQTYSSYFQN